MEKDRILKKLEELPTRITGVLLEEEDMWEGDDNSAHFTLSKNFVVYQNRRYNFITLSVSGPKKDKERLITDFITALGEPNEHTPHPDFAEIDLIAWFPTKQPKIK